LVGSRISRGARGKSTCNRKSDLFSACLPPDFRDPFLKRIDVTLATIVDKRADPHAIAR
jgi:hypothetical protein